MPIYVIHQTSFIGNRLYDAGAKVNLPARHIPGPHWEPICDEAKAICKRHKIRFDGDRAIDVIDIILDGRQDHKPKELSILDKEIPKDPNGVIDGHDDDDGAGDGGAGVGGDNPPIED